MANYAVEMNRTASATLSVGDGIADATRPRRGEGYELVFGSDASPADNQFPSQRQPRRTAATVSSVPSPAVQPRDGTSESDAAENHMIVPTLTAVAILLSCALNQRATCRWVAPPGAEFVYPATASNGLALRPPTSAAVAVSATVWNQEQ